jgi:L-lactate dehydrogenase complex protein LldG
MSSAREDIFANIRRSLGATGREAPRIAAVTERLRSAPSGVVPARGHLPREARIALFKEQAESVQASVSVVARSAELPAEVARFLREHNLPANLRLGTDPRLTGLDWATTALALSFGPSEGDDLNAVSHAFAGVAETGTLALVSGADNPTTLNFLADNHIVVLRADDLAPDYESVWARLRETYGKGLMPRTVNLITGPSRSGDIEQQIILGAHGPRRLHIVIVES